jgi:hypothetical protein
MGGPQDSRKWALKRNLPALIHAKDILRLIERGVTDVRPDIIEACHKATESPSLLMYWEKSMIEAEWLRRAKAGQLRGIRSAANARPHAEARSADSVQADVGQGG